MAASRSFGSSLGMVRAMLPDIEKRSRARFKDNRADSAASIVFLVAVVVAVAVAVVSDMMLIEYIKSMFQCFHHGQYESCQKGATVVLRATYETVLVLG